MGTTENAKRSEGEVFFQSLLWLRLEDKNPTHTFTDTSHTCTHTAHYIIYLAVLQSIYINFSVYFHD